MSVSTVSVIGAQRTLREGFVESEQDPVYGAMADRRWFVGGQSARSEQVALWALENLLDGPEGYRVDNVVWGGLPSRCASLRHGNCLHFDLVTPVEYGRRVEVFGEFAEQVCE